MVESRKRHTTSKYDRTNDPKNKMQNIHMVEYAKSFQLNFNHCFTTSVCIAYAQQLPMWAGVLSCLAATHGLRIPLTCDIIRPIYLVHERIARRTRTMQMRNFWRRQTAKTKFHKRLWRQVMDLYMCFMCSFFVLLQS